MPKSKNGKLYYTEEQFKFAKYEITALEYAQRNGIPLEPEGRYWKHKEHDSLVFAPNGNFFWNAHNIHGDAITFASFVEGKTYVEAVLAVAGETEHILQNNATVSEKIDEIKAEQQEKRISLPSAQPAFFKLPEAADNYKRLFAYLCNERKIDNSIVSTMVHEKRIFQSAAHGNVIFVGYDEKGEAASAYQRGTYTFAKQPFKGDVIGSRKEVPFIMPAEMGDCSTVYVFEAAIDAMSHATLVKHSPDANWRDVNRISLGCVSQNALDWYLTHNPQIKNLVLCLDNDDAGRAATQHIGVDLVARGYEVSEQVPKHKDWNEELKAFCQEEVAENKFSMLISNNSVELEM